MTAGVAFLAAAAPIPDLARASSAAPEVATSGPISAWTVNGMTRLARNAPVGKGTSAVISAARGETEPYQIGVRASGAELTGGDLTVSELSGPGGAEIPASASIRYREHFVPVPIHSPDVSGPVLTDNEFPDALLPFVDPATGKAPAPEAAHRAYPYAVADGQTQPFWVDVKVPRDAKPGKYTGSWTVSTDQGEVSGKVELQVRDFTLPLVPAEESSFGVWWKTETDRQQLENLLLDFSIQPTYLDDPARSKELVDKHGAQSAAVGFYSGANYHDCTMKPAPTVQEVRDHAALYDKRLKLYAYTVDEVHNCPHLYGQIKEYGRVLHEGGVRQLAVTVPTPELLDDGTGRPAVDDWVLLPRQARELDPAVEQAVRDSGGKLWSYQALVQGKNTPSWQIDFPPANHRILPGFLNTATGYSGILYWTVNFWKPNPWDNQMDPNNAPVETGCCFPGDGNLVYPGDRAGVTGSIPSMRLAWVREGIEDYGYADLYRKAGGKDLADLIAPAATDWDNWTQDPAKIYEARERLAVGIEGNAPPPVEPTDEPTTDEPSPVAPTEPTDEPAPVEEPTDQPVTDEPSPVEPPTEAAEEPAPVEEPTDQPVTDEPADEFSPPEDRQSEWDELISLILRIIGTGRG
ncbi:MAG: glycoside hydrolase domain-containing protein [Nocardioides sp.]